MVGLKKVMKWRWNGTRPAMLTKAELNEVLNKFFFFF